ncbi:MAG: response regulator, partial [Proteobacteria bacterium]
LFETPLNDLQQRYLRVLSRSSQTLLDLLNSLLDFSSLESGKTKIEAIEFDLHTVLEKVVDLSAVRAHEKNLDLSLDIDLKTPLAVTGDPVRLQQVLNNLLSNAIKFTSVGEVRLTVKPISLPSGALSIHFAVSDTGIGIRQEALGKVFESFVQADTSTRRQYGGSGLGLTISKELVALMGGDLKVSSEFGVGSQFDFSLPLVPEAQVTQTLGERAKLFDLRGHTAFFVGPMTPSMQQASELIQACGGVTEARLQAVDLACDKTFVLISPLADDSLIQFLPERVSENTRVICLIQTILPATRMKTYLGLGVTEFVMSPLKPLEFLQTIAKREAKVSEVETLLGQSDEASLDETVAHSSKLRVLVVDDSTENRDLVALFLGKETDLALSYAADGSQAVHKVQTEKFDLVLTDIQMPVMDGIEELVAIREWEEAKHLPKLPIVAITADSRPEARLNLARLGFEEILIKPIRKVQLIETLARYRYDQDPRPRPNELD